MSLSLRRSVWGSLRSVSPFLSSPQPQEYVSESDHDKAMTSVNRVMYFSRSKGAEMAPKSGKAARCLPRTITMTAFDAEGRPPPPKLDRDFDLVGFLDIDSDYACPSSAFEIVCPQRALEDCSSAFFILPSSIRHLVYSFCLIGEQNKITLSPRFATKAVFDDDYFASPWDVLEPVWGGLATSQELRKELLAYFWTEYHFHVSINPFSGPKFSPLSQIWLPKYLGIIQYLTIEIDFTRFGGSALNYASSIGFECRKLERMFVDLLEGLQLRPDQAIMAELVILSRRYLGHRPIDGVFVTSEESPWYPNEFTFMQNSLRGLCGRIQQCRIAGFPYKWTKILLHALFSDAKTIANLAAPRDSAWPPLPLYEPPIRAPTALNAYSIIPYAQYDSTVATSTRRSTYGTYNQPESPQTPNSSCTPAADVLIMPSARTEAGSHPSEWKLTLHHSTSFIEMLGQASEESPKSIGSQFIASKNAAGEDVLIETLSALREEGHIILNNVQSYESLFMPKTSSSTSKIGTTPLIVNTAPHLPSPKRSVIAPTKTVETYENLSPATIYSELLALHSHSPEPLSLPLADSIAIECLPVAVADISMPSPARRTGLPPSMSVMNALNEQDPAFIRTMEALRPLNETLTRTPAEKTQRIQAASTAEHADRTISSTSTRSNSGAKKRYMSFMSRFRGHGHE